VGAALALVEDGLALVGAAHLQRGVLGMPVAALGARLLHRRPRVPLLVVHRLGGWAAHLVNVG
jgi:hypothetical protein